MIIILSQEVCPRCTQLYQYLKFAQQDKYKDQIKIVKKEDSPEEFKQLTKQFHIMATPVMIIGEHVLKDCSPLNVGEFLAKYANEIK